MADAVAPSAQMAYSGLSQKGITTVLEVAVTSAQFQGQGGSDPDLTLSLRARGKLIRVEDGNILWSTDQLPFSTTNHKLSEWKSNDAELLKSNVDYAVTDYAQRIFDAAFFEFWSNPERKP
jgi:hypothetical protein